MKINLLLVRLERLLQVKSLKENVKDWQGSNEEIKPYLNVVQFGLVDPTKFILNLRSFIFGPKPIKPSASIELHLTL
jgi:hypothetical protein